MMIFLSYISAFSMWTIEYELRQLRHSTTDGAMQLVANVQLLFQDDNLSIRFNYKKNIIEIL